MSYRWYYTDVAAAEWTVVVIFMWSPVFSARGGATAVNAAVYRGGKRERWVFTEYSGARRDGARYHIGASWLESSADGVRIAIRDREPSLTRRQLQLDLTLRPLCPSAPAIALSAGSPHWWQAVMPRAEATLGIDGTSYSGLGYHDSNWGDAPLGGDISAWTWTRQHGRKQTWISYQLLGRTHPHIVSADADGCTLQLGAEHRADWQRSAWGLALPRSVGGLPTGRLIESSPFYARLHTVDADGDRLTEVAHFRRFLCPAFRWMPTYRSRAELVR